jgi:hypothetical protein
MAAHSDEWILEHVDDICLVLVELTKHAIAIYDRPWLRRHVWWRAGPCSRARRIIELDCYSMSDLRR